MGRERERAKIYWASVDRSQAEGSAVCYPGLARSPRAPAGRLAWLWARLVIC